ncbi:MAG: hypothetical protein O7D28_09735 [Actinobacteria bacterium]|nr:hypothetical protein [Actinomycetota bacterium]
MGGSARHWSTNIEDGLEPGSPIEMRLVMTNFGSEIVTIGYLVVLSTES